MNIDKEKLKEAISIADFGIQIDEKQAGEVSTLCPKCSHGRQKKTARCLSVNLDKRVWFCHHCGWKGRLEDGNSETIIKVYPYHDETGNLLFQKVRYPSKEFRLRKPKRSGGWTWKLGNTKRVLYRLPELLKSTGTVYLVGGEKDADNLSKHNLAATTNFDGEAKWKSEYNLYFKDREVVIIEDNDEKGRAHGKLVSEHLFKYAQSIKIIRFKDCKSGCDVSDYLEENSIEELKKLVDEAPIYQGSYASYFGEENIPDSHVTISNGSFSDLSGDEKPTQAQSLIDLTSSCEFFHNPDGTAYVTYLVEDHNETSQVRSKSFKLWLGHKFFSQFNKPPGNQALSDALGILEGRARFEGKTIPVYTRIGEADGNIYLDLCNDKWEVVEITCTGWKVISQSPVKFVRARGMGPLPHPVSGGKVDELFKFINIREDQKKLVVGYLIAALKSKGPFPILVIQGEHGSAKSTFSRIIRSVVDPSISQLRSTPKECRDLMISARNSWILAFDNLSGIPPWLSDAFCRLSTGGGFSTRELYTDSEEIIFDSQRPMILNGIDDICKRDDLRDRSLIFFLPRIPREKRKDEKTLLKDFEEARPKILGALLDTVCHALKEYEKVTLNSYPRMADFAKWVTAAESFLGWESGSFLKEYENNLALAIENSLETDVLAQAIIQFIVMQEKWEGSFSDLFSALGKQIDFRVSGNKQWPKSPSVLSNRVRRLAPTLLEIGIEVDFDQRKKGTGRKIVTFRKVPENVEQADMTNVMENNSFINKEFLVDEDLSTQANADKRPPKNTTFKNKDLFGPDGDNGVFPKKSKGNLDSSIHEVKI